MRNKAFVCWFGLLISCAMGSLHAQDVTALAERAFLRQVLLYHPVVLSEELETERVRQNVQVARAAFDPVWMSDWSTKEFEGKAYYDYQRTSFSWQAPPGIKFRAGAERNRGDFVNPEFNTPADGLYFAEVAIPLGEGLFRSEAQTRLQKARVDADRAMSQLELTTRHVVLHAAELYWNWVAADREIALRREIESLAEERFGQINIRFRQGLATGMDTLEAYTQFLQREGERLNSEQNLEAWYQTAGNMIWEDELFRAYRNGKLSVDSQWVSVVDPVNHVNRSPLVNPMMEIIDQQMKAARLDYAMARERLKPDLHFKAGALAPQGSYSITGNSTVFGLSAYIPLISRRERAEVKMTGIRMNQLELTISARERELIQQFEQFSAQLTMLQEQVSIAGENVTNARELLRMETKLLLFGESTLILVNLRETNYINAQLQYINVLRRQKMLEWRLALLTYSAEELLL